MCWYRSSTRARSTLRLGWLDPQHAIMSVVLKTTHCCLQSGSFCGSRFVCVLRRRWTPESSTKSSILVMPRSPAAEMMCLESAWPILPFAHILIWKDRSWSDPWSLRCGLGRPVLCMYMFSRCVRVPSETSFGELPWPWVCLGAAPSHWSQRVASLVVTVFSVCAVMFALCL